MFVTLLVVTFVIAFAVSTIVARFFREPLDKILSRIIADDISRTWSKYLIFAIYVTGISSGVRIWDLEKYITAPHVEGAKIINLTGQRWVFEVYRTVIETLQGIAWMLLIFFVFALIAYVIVRAFEMKRQKPDQKS
jgi:peptidoglycan/LPS O-acetylase OafA/YrhL